MFILKQGFPFPAQGMHGQLCHTRLFVEDDLGLAKTYIILEAPPPPPPRTYAIETCGP